MSEMSNAEPMGSEPAIEGPAAHLEASELAEAEPAQEPAPTAERSEPVADVEAESAPEPRAPRVAVPSPAALANRHGAPSARSFGRVDDDGVVYVRTAEGERAVGSYPGASPSDAIGYFVRKFDELVASADLLLQRIRHTDMPAKDASDAHAKLVEHTTEPNVVGDLAALAAKVAEIGDLIDERRGVESAAKAAAREAAKARRGALVEEAERIAAQDPERTQWKSSGARMRELLDEWKSEQRSGARIDKESESALWHRFSAARNSFDKARRTYFSQLDAAQGDAKRLKERLVDEAEHLAKSTDWAATAGAFKALMSRWREAGRASRQDDDALWTRFKAAQDSFFAAKDEIVQREDEEYRANLAVKETLLAEAEALLPVTDLEAAKTALRGIQDRWEAAGKVPRADLERTERALKRIEQGVRDAEQRRWQSTNPEAAARARSMVEQLEASVAVLGTTLSAARERGDAKAVVKAEDALRAQQQWLDQARAGLAEFGG